MKKFSFPLVAAVVISFAFATIYAYGSTTISTNITTGGTLTVSGNSTFGDANTDVNLFTGTVQASTTALFTAGARMYNTLQLYNAATGGTALEGGLYYNTTDKVVKMYDGSNWYTIGTTTSGLTLTGRNLKLADTQYYMTFGTSTQQGLSVLTLSATSTASIPLTLERFTGQTSDIFKAVTEGAAELFAVDYNGSWTIATSTVANAVVTIEATSTKAIPLTIRGYTGQLQAGDLFRIHDVAGTELFAIDKGGNASTSMIDMSAGFVSNASSTVVGAFTAAGNVRLGDAQTDTVTINGGITLASTTQLNVGGKGTNGTISDIVFGTCTLARTTITATTTLAVDCTSATGISATTHMVFVTATSTLHEDFIIQAASSTAANTLNLRIYNTGHHGTTSTSIPASILIQFLGIK